MNPVRDIEIINEELRLKDEEFLKAVLDKTERMMRSDKKVKTEYVSNMLTVNCALWKHYLTQFYFILLLRTFCAS